MQTKFRVTEKHIPIYILILCILSYGLTLLVGYYWDDWFVIWNFHAMGARGVYESYITVRPIHGYLLGYLMELLGEAPVTWHIAALFVRYTGAITCWLLLRQVWPRHTFENALVAAFIAIYPGFTQQALPLVYILLLFGAMNLWALSVWLTLFSYRNKRYRVIFVPLACLLSFTHLAISEYFIGLEFVRPLLVGLVFAQISTLNLKSSWRIWVKEILLHWLPNLATLIIYLVYRLVIFQSGRPATNTASIIQQITANPLAELSRRMVSLLTDPIRVIVLAWIQPLSHFFVSYITSPRIWWNCMGVFAIVTLLSWAFYLSLIKSERNTESRSPKWELQALGLGLYAVVFAGLPLWGIGREVTLGELADRYSYPFIFGSALILASSIFLMAKNPRTRYILAAFIVGISAGFHVWNTYIVFQTDWSNQRDFHSQLSWRVPGLQKGTSIWVVKNPSVMLMEGDHGLAMPVNWIYGPDQHNGNLNFWVYPLADEFLNRIPLFRSGSETPFTRPLLNTNFTGNPQNTMVVWFAPPSCLKVIDPNQQELLNALPIPTIGKLLAHIDPIITKPAQAQEFPENVFGIREKDWCYYFEQADLARQTTDWQEVALLKDQAVQKGLKPFHDSEWLPFIEAYIHLDRYDDASRLISLIKDGQLASSKILICGLVDRMTTDRSTDNNLARNKFLRNILQQSGCSISKQ